MSDDVRRIHTSLAVARRERGMTQQQLAARMRAHGFTSWYSGKVSAVEAGKRTLKLPEIITLACELGISTDVLMIAHPNEIGRRVRESGGARC
ncbi:helix-turn-helix domain-containing protein [Nocardia nova]